jgi:uncharacterized iron-regulated protein
MINRIDIDRTGYHLTTHQTSKVQKTSNTKKEVPLDKKTQETSSKTQKTQAVKVAQRANYIRLIPIQSKQPKQVIKTYASHRKAVYEDRIKTRFDLML